ncbi:MAG: 50S ribosomal protein L17 [Patescibacteria group bacterium]
MSRIKTKRRFGRKKSQKKALMQSLSRSLIQHGRIKTTHAKAKELRTFVEPLITAAKEDTTATRRKLSKHFDKKIVKKLVDEIGPKYKERPGGYTRIIKLGPRKSDNAKEVFIELV